MQKPTTTLLFGFLLLSQILFAQEERPNIVWIVSEDNSVHYLDLYTPGAASMPHIEALAEKGLVFNHMFSMGPVCSVARSTIISGCYAPRTGTQYHRRTELVPLPEGLKMFPHYLREAGYYTSNNAKEDYNYLKSEGVWDNSSRQATYRDRQAGQPFFHVQNFGTTHEGQLHFSEAQRQERKTSRDPETITPFPYHPNTPLFRYTYAWYYELHQRVDKQIGEFLGQLEADGLMENTIIFYYGDHGGVLPRSKGYIYESGLHVPLVVYFPPKWQHLAPATPGSRIDGFTRFIDLAPTVLNLAGASIPEQIDGKAFLGKGISLEELNSRNTAFSYADRFDEKYDLVRGLRKGKFKYMRNYQPFNYDGLHNFYRYKMLAYLEWEELYHKGKLDKHQRQFFEARPAEALYNIEEDPHELHNLANDPAYQSTLTELRGELTQQVQSLPDLSFIPEPYFVKEGIENPVAFGQKNKQDIESAIAIADLALLPFAEARIHLQDALKSSKPLKRYWAWVVCSSFGKKAKPFMKLAKKSLATEQDNLVKMRLIEFMALNKGKNMGPRLTSCLKNAESVTEANLILNTVTLLQDLGKIKKGPIPTDIFPSEWVENERSLVSRRLGYLNTR